MNSLPIWMAGKTPKRVVRWMNIEGGSMLDGRACLVNTANELDSEIRDIFALDLVGRGDEIAGTLFVDYSDDSVKNATLIRALEHRGVTIVWRKRARSA